MGAAPVARAFPCSRFVFWLHAATSALSPARASNYLAFSAASIEATFFRT